MWCCGCFLEQYISWISRMLGAVFGGMDEVVRRRIGYFIIVFHIVGVVVLWLIPFVVPATLVWIVIYLMGIVGVYVHWYVLRGCCVTPIEKFFLGWNVEDMDPYFSRLVYKYFGVDTVVTKAMVTVTPLVGLVVMGMRWWWRGLV